MNHIIPGCKHFTWAEATWLPSWDRCALPPDGLTPEVEKNLTELFQRMEHVRDFLGVPTKVIVAFRPEEYNTLIGGAKKSAHIEGKAVDFVPVGLTVEQATAMILLDNKLVDWNMRMEKHPGNWIHLDIRDLKPDGNRYFLP